MTSDTRHSILLLSWSLTVLTYACQPQSVSANDKFSSSCASLDGRLEPVSESLLQMRHQRISYGAAEIGDDMKVDRNGHNIDNLASFPVVVTEMPATGLSAALVGSNETLPLQPEVAPKRAVAVETWKAYLQQQAGDVGAISKQTLGSTVLVAVIVVLVLNLAPKDAAPSFSEKKRSVILDNTKIFALCMVILADILYYNLTNLHDHASFPGYTDWQTWLSGSADLLRATLEVLNSLMVPILCFTSGVLSQGPTSEKRIKRFIERLVVPTLLWVYFVKPVVFATLIDPDLAQFMSRVHAMFKLRSFQEEWYLQALIIWRLSTVLFWSHLRPSIAFGSMLTLSAVAGYVNLSGPLWYLKLDEALGFLPYFGIGYIFPFDAVHRACGRQRLPGVFALALAVLWVLGVAGRVGPLPDNHGNYQCCTAGAVFKEAQGWEYSLYWTRRLARVALEMPPAFLVIFCVIPQKETSISWVGPYTIYPFLFHQIANYWRSQLFKYLQPPYVENTAGHVTILLLHVPYVLAVLVFFASRPWRAMFSWFVEPEWVRHFLKSPQDVKQGLERSANRQSPCGPSQAHASTFDDAQELSMDEDGTEEQPRFNGIHRTKHEAGDETEWNVASELECEEDDVDEGASEGSTPELPPSHRTHRGLWQSTGPPIPWQAEAIKYYPWLLPIFLMLVLFGVCNFVLFQAYIGMEFVIALLEALPLSLSIFFFLAALLLTSANYIYHYYRLRGTDQLPEAPEADPLTHAIVVVAYKEPLDVLQRTVDSLIAQHGLRKKPILVFATEGRDPTAQSCFDIIKRRVGNAFEECFITKHVLAEGETIGKSSNENWAVQELYRILVEEQARDPFEVLVTIIDADSVVSSTYLAHLEVQFRDMRDGRRLIYTGPLNVHRNFADACLLTQAIDLNRCHGDTFFDPLSEVQPQSNYSLTLGFAQEIGFWTPDVMAEDIHAGHRAMVHTFGSRTTVMIPSFICNDLVPDFIDRYVQAKRHQWGSLAETAWIISLLLDMRLSFPNWFQVVKHEMRREGSFFYAVCEVVTSIVKVLVLIWFYYEGQLSQRGWKFKLYILMILAAFIYSYVMYWIAELVLWQTLLRQFPIKRVGYFRWSLLVCLLPVLLVFSDKIFFVGASLHCMMLMSAGVDRDIRYVVAPKGEKLKGARCDQKGEKHKGGSCDSPKKGSALSSC